MDDDKKIKQTEVDVNNNQDYQKILDQYAASIKSEDSQPENLTPEPQPEATAKLEEAHNEVKTDEKIKLKDVNSLQLESGSSLPLQNTENEDSQNQELPPISESKPEEKNSSEPLTQVNQVSEIKDTPPIDTSFKEPTKTPEEIKAEIDKILVDDSTNNESNASDLSIKSSKKSNSLKTIFIFSLIIFFTVAALWVYFLFFYQPTTKNSSSVTPTSIPTVSQEICELNGETYQVGESFPSADGCNTCSCEPTSVITCTEMACTFTPTVTTNLSTQSAIISPSKISVTPTKSVTPSTTISPSL